MKRFLEQMNPVAVVLVGAVMISFSAVWVVLAGVPPMTSAFYRVFIGALFLGAAMLINGERIRNLQTILLPSLGCGFFFALDLYFWHTSIRYIGPGLATILGNFQVFLMAGFGYLFFKERLSLRFVFSMPLAIGGLFLIIGFNWSTLTPNYKIGIYYGLLTALCYTLFLLTLRQIKAATADKGEFSTLFIVSFFSALILAAVMMVNGTSFAIPSYTSGFSLVCLGFMSQFAGWMLIARAMPQLPPSLTGLSLLTQPTLSFFWDVLFFSRPTTGLHWLGASITICAIYLGLTGSHKGHTK